MADPFVMRKKLYSVRHQILHDLHSVGGGAFSDLVAAAPEAQAVLGREIPAEPADVYKVLIGSVQGSGDRLLHEDHPGGRRNGVFSLFHRNM